MHHIDLADRTAALGNHLTGAILLADSGFFGPALALMRTCLEHHVIDRLALLGADHPVHDSSGQVVERVSSYWEKLQTWSPYRRHKDLSGPFDDPETADAVSKQQHDIYRTFFSWSSLCKNLLDKELCSKHEHEQLQVHYGFLSAFTHAHATSASLEHSVYMPGRKPAEFATHLLGELALLYATVIGVAELTAWRRYVDGRRHLLAPLEPRLIESAEEAEHVISYFWFLTGSRQQLDLVDEAHRRSYPALREGKPPPFRPEDLGFSDVRYYTDPFKRLARLHCGGFELTSGFTSPPLWPTWVW